MTGQEIITKFENMVDDVLDTDYAYQLLDDAKNEVEEMRNWEILKKSLSFTNSTGQNPYTSLPLDFAVDLEVSEDNLAYTKVGIQDEYQKQNNPFGYYLDLVNSRLYLTGNKSEAKSMVFMYKYTSGEITSATSWVFPSRFHSILAFKMAEMYYASDAGEKSRSWDDRWSNQFERMLRRMEVWDDSLKVNNYKPRRFYDNPKGINI